MSSVLLQGRHSPGSHVGTLPALRQGWFGPNLSIPHAASCSWQEAGSSA